MKINSFIVKLILQHIVDVLVVEHPVMELMLRGKRNSLATNQNSLFSSRDWLSANQEIMLREEQVGLLLAANDNN